VTMSTEEIDALVALFEQARAELQKAADRKKAKQAEIARQGRLMRRMDEAR
jgi:hypothetical protein